MHVHDSRCRARDAWFRNLLTTAEVGECLRVSAQTVRAYVRQGMLKAISKSSGRLLFERREVERFLDSRLHSQKGNPKTKSKVATSKPWIEPNNQFESWD